jgi:tetratricopeptide (TPR) repeat protein
MMFNMWQLLTLLSPNRDGILFRDFTTVFRIVAHHSIKEDTMNHRPFGLGLLFLMLLVWSGCDSGEYGKETKTEPKTESTPMPATEAPKMAETPQAQGALMAAAGVAGAPENNEGVDHYQQGHYDVAQEHFMKSIAANAGLAEAHYNLALALDKMNKHPEATTHFKKALELAPADPKIAGSKILQAHVGA